MAGSVDGTAETGQAHQHGEPPVADLRLPPVVVGQAQRVKWDQSKEARLHDGAYVYVGKPPLREAPDRSTGSSDPSTAGAPLPFRMSPTRAFKGDDANQYVCLHCYSAVGMPSHLALGEEALISAPLQRAVQQVAHDDDCPVLEARVLNARREVQLPGPIIPSIDGGKPSATRTQVHGSACNSPSNASPFAGSDVAP